MLSLQDQIAYLTLRLREAENVLEVNMDMNNRMVVREDHPDAIKSPTMSGGLYTTGRAYKQYKTKYPEPITKLD